MLFRLCLLLQRVVLLSVDSSTGLISMRHFSISTAPSGVKKSLKALVSRQALPDLGRLQDVSELVTKSGYGSVRGAVPTGCVWQRAFCLWLLLLAPWLSHRPRLL